MSILRTVFIKEPSFLDYNLLFFCIKVRAFLRNRLLLKFTQL